MVLAPGSGESPEEGAIVIKPNWKISTHNAASLGDELRHDLETLAKVHSIREVNLPGGSHVIEIPGNIAAESQLLSLEMKDEDDMVVEGDDDEGQLEIVETVEGDSVDDLGMEGAVVDDQTDPEMTGFMFMCGLCNSLFQSQEAVEGHMQNDHGSQDVVYSNPNNTAQN